jgi:putrescine aminotransferase
MDISNDLVGMDRKHVLHPLHHPSSHTDPLVFKSGNGIWLRTADGQEYMDAVAGLWNVLVGYGNHELASAAKEQLIELAYSSNYVGMTNIPVIELAQKLAGFAYPSMNTTFFASGGAEANETAFKTARYYWKRKGKPNKVQIISLQGGYHGVTLAAMSATGISRYWPMFEPRVPGFLHVAAPNPFRFQGQVKEGESIAQAASRALEEVILRQGSDVVAAFIAEPIQGVGGVIVPPAEYFPMIREICDRHEVLMIADEVITGFGRTGKWFAHNHWGVEPDILSFAKGVTSGYLPLGGIQISDEIRDAIMSAPPDETWMHAYTYSGHATCCAVALKNLEIMERDGLVEKSATQGTYLLERLKELDVIPCVGDIRGLGMMCAVEFVADRSTKQPASIGPMVLNACRERGLISRITGESLLFAPPLIISREEIDKLVDIVRESVEEVWSSLP